MQPAQNNVLIELHVPDFQKVKDFYGKLGFNITWERIQGNREDYLLMKLGDNVLSFWPGNENVYDQTYFKKFPQDTKRGYGVEIVIMLDNIDEFYNRVKSFASVVEELKTQPWGLKDFRVEDPFGFYLRFTEPHNILDPGNAVY